MLHVAGDVDTGDLVLVALHESQNVGFRLVLGHRQGGVDINLVGSGDLVEHHLEGFQIGQRLTAGKHKITIGCDGVHPPDALTDFFGGKARQIRVFTFVDAEGTMVLAVIRDEDRYRGAAFPRLIGMFHVESAFQNRC